MNEHFAKQLKDCTAMTEESIAELKQNRIDKGLTTDSIDHLVPGDVQLLVMVERPDGIYPVVHIEKILEREIDEFEAQHEFLNMAGKDLALPRYKEKEKKIEN